MPNASLLMRALNRSTMPPSLFHLLDAGGTFSNSAVGLGRPGFGMPILCPKVGAGFGEGCCEAAAVVGRQMSEAERKCARGFAPERDGAAPGLVVLDREVDRARAAVDGHEQEALAPLAVAGLPLWRMLDVNVHEARVIVSERALPLGKAFGAGLWPSIQALGLEDAPNAVAVELRQEVGDGEGEVIEGKLVARRRLQAMARSSLLALHGEVAPRFRPPWRLEWQRRELVRRRGAVEAVGNPSLAPLAHALRADAVALGDGAAGSRERAISARVAGVVRAFG